MFDKKPGGESSKMGVVIGVIMIVIGVLWTAVALRIDKTMAIFGIVWTAIAIGNTIYNYKHGSAVSGFSLSDLISGRNSLRDSGKAHEGSRYCPYCGMKAEDSYAFCNRCGKKLP